MSEVSEKSENPEQVDVKLDDILKSIRGIIDDHNQVVISESNGSDFIADEDPVLELTSVVSDYNDSNEASDSDLLSGDTRHKTELEINKFADYLKTDNYFSKDKSLDSMVNNLMKPLVREWLNSNLPRIVEKVVSEEIRKMVPKQ